jgi:threonine/homoserine/homoserine lactone efflux protein
MDVTTLLVSTVAVSFSGALSPGPLTISAIAIGARKCARGGFLVALGHMLFEIPYIIAITLFAFSADFFLKKPSVSYILTSVMFGFVLFFSYTNIKDGIDVLMGGEFKMKERGMIGLNPVFVGFLLTCLNPYFLLWWLSIGLPLLRLSSSMGSIYLLIMYVAHVWLDYLWLTLMGFAGERSAKLLKSKGYGLLLIILGLILAVFAIDLALKAYFNLSLLPF